MCWVHVLSQVCSVGWVWKAVRVRELDTNHTHAKGINRLFLTSLHACWIPQIWTFLHCSAVTVVLSSSSQPSPGHCTVPRRRWGGEATVWDKARGSIFNLLHIYLITNRLHFVSWQDLEHRALWVPTMTHNESNVQLSDGLIPKFANTHHTDSQSADCSLYVHEGVHCILKTQIYSSA